MFAATYLLSRVVEPVLASHHVSDKRLALAVRLTDRCGVDCVSVFMFMMYRIG